MMNSEIHLDTIESHFHNVLHIPSDTFGTVTVSATTSSAFGPEVRLGDWSLGASDARLLAESLVILAGLADGAHR